MGETMNLNELVDVVAEAWAAPRVRAIMLSFNLPGGPVPTP